MPKRKQLHPRDLSAAEADLAIHLETQRLTTDPEFLPVIKVVGMSGAGKSTLVRRLRQAGFRARAVSQEHSAVPLLWQAFDRPLILIYLTLSLETQKIRRADVSWTAEYYHQEESRLESARQNADLRIDTSQLAPEAVFQVALAFLRETKVRRADTALQPLPSTGSASSPRAETPTASQT